VVVVAVCVDGAVTATHVRTNERGWTYNQKVEVGSARRVEASNTTLLSCLQKKQWVHPSKYGLYKLITT